MNNYRNEILTIFEKANTSIQVAVSWFTDELLIEWLTKNSSKIKIDVLLSSDNVNLLRHDQFHELQSNGAIVNKIGSKNAIEGKFMHSKFIIIDRKEAFGGSYNFTSNARTNYETFKKYSYEEVPSLLHDFKEWINNSENLFKGINNPEKIVNDLIIDFNKNRNDTSRPPFLISSKKNNFSEENYILSKNNNDEKSSNNINSFTKSKSKNNRCNSKIETHKNQVNNFKHQESNTLERRNIIELEEKKTKLRENIKTLNEGTSTISPCGNITKNNNGTTVKPHRYYGGKAVSLINTNSSKQSYSFAYYQNYFINKSFDFMNCNIINNTLICKGKIKPDNCGVYNICIEFKSGFYPKVFIANPKIEANPNIHMYADDSLCLFYSGDIKWKSTIRIAEYIIPWTIEWIMLYELWKITGKWEGDEKSH